MRSFKDVAFEAVTVGFVLYIIFLLVNFIMKPFDMPRFAKVITSGILAHLLFEYGPFGNINMWWCKKTFT